MDAINYKCPCCSSALEFQGQEQQLVCPSCGNKYSPSQLEDYDAFLKKSAEDEISWDEYQLEHFEQEGLTGYSCPSCGGEIAGDANTAATCCPYCGNNTVLPSRLKGMYRPDYIIPFKLEKDDAVSALKGFCKGKRLLPKNFLEQNRVDQLQGMYVPFWLFDCHADGDMSFSATKSSTWADSKYIYTKTDHYAITRGGVLDFSKVPADGSSRMADNLMDAIEPFDYSALIPFGPVYLSGYLADKYDIDSKDCTKRVNERIITSVQDALRNTVKGYNTVITKNSSVKIGHGKIKYALIPIWILTTRYQDKPYTFIINGQTGKLAGELPVDKKRYWSFLLSIFGGISVLGAIIIILITLLGGGV